MYCTSCGFEVGEAAKFCSKCGAIVSGDAIPTRMVDREVGIQYGRGNGPDLLRLSDIHGKGGIVIVIVSVIWWIATFGASGRLEQFSDALQCLYSDNLWCQLFVKVHHVSMPYTPVALGVGAVSTLLGAVLGSSVDSNEAERRASRSIPNKKVAAAFGFLALAIAIYWIVL